MEDILMISLHQEYSNLILQGEKRVELRKYRPQIERGGLILLYTTRPVQAIVGLAEVQSIVKKPIEELFREVHGLTGGTEKDFFNYYAKKEYGVAIFLEEVWPLSPWISLLEIREQMPTFRPPQNYLYFDPFDFIEKWEELIEERSSYDLTSIKERL